MPGFDYGGNFDTQANLGLGQNSTLLNALKDSGRIASRTYSYWWGVGTATEGVTRDGALVLGGYDAAKVLGPNITGTLQPWSLGCPSGMYVTVSGMELNFPNGTNADILTPSILTACLQVDFPYLMTFPEDPFFQKFESYAQTESTGNSQGIYWWAQEFSPGTAYQGDITFKLTSGFDLRVPNEVFIVPEQYVGASGGVETNNEASLMLLGGTKNDNSDDTPIIGMPFFSSAYLMVDLDAATFTLWQANMTEESRLVAIGASVGCTDSPDVNSNTTAGSTSDASGSSSDGADQGADDGEAGSNNIGAGAIAGAAIGGAAAVALVGAVCYICVRRRQKQRNGQQDAQFGADGSKVHSWHGSPASHGDAQKSSSYLPYRPHNGTSEMSNETGRVEMSANQPVPYEIDSQQKMAELSHTRFDAPVEMPSVHTPKLRPS